MTSLSHAAFIDGDLSLANRVFADWLNGVNDLAFKNTGRCILSSVAGTNTITATSSPEQAAYKAGQFFTFTPAGTNTGAVTLNISGLGAKSLFSCGAALVGGELGPLQPVSCFYDGVRFVLLSGWGKGLISLSRFATAGSGTFADPYTGWTGMTPVAGMTYDIDGYFSGTLPDFRKGGIWLRGRGEYISGFKGTAPSAPVLSLDGGTGAVVAANYGFQVSDLSIWGNGTNSTYGIDLRNIHQAKIINVSVLNVATAGLRGRFCIGAEVRNFVNDINPGRSTLSPTYGLLMDTDGVNGGCNTWLVTNANIRGCSSYGINAVYAQACTFVETQTESNDAGSVPAVQIRLQTSSTANTLIGCYSNNTMLDDGLQNNWIGITSADLKFDNARQCGVFRGKVDTFTASNTSVQCTLFGMLYTTTLTNNSASLATRGVMKTDGTYYDDVIFNNISGMRFVGQIEPVSETLSASGAFATTSRTLGVSGTVSPVVTTWAPALLFGQLGAAFDVSASGTIAHSIKFVGGTWEGTNNTMTVNAVGEGVTFMALTPIRVYITSTSGTPTFSNT